MAVYPPIVGRKLISSSNAGRVENANAVSKAVSFICGSFISLSLRIDDTTGVTTEVKFRTNGCGYVIASADVLTGWLAGRSVADMHGLRDSELREVLESELGSSPSDRSHCGEIVFDALRRAMADYRRHRIEEFQGERGLICTCFGVAEDTLVEVIARNEVKDVDDVGHLCRAGTGCGSCRMLIQELIDARPMDRDYR